MAQEDQFALGQSALLTAVRVIYHYQELYPEAAKFFANRLMDITPERWVWALQVAKIFARLDQHKEDCNACKTAPCPKQVSLQTRLDKYRSLMDNGSGEQV